MTSKNTLETINYYETNAQNFSNSTFKVKFDKIQELFTKYLKDGSNILDFGCGSGRDSLKFKEMGYNVFPIDGSKEFCKITEKNTGLKTRCMLFSQLDEEKVYDGIWACSSLLHVEKKKLPNIFKKVHNALKNNGIFYCSFKFGNFEGIKNQRYFSNFTEKSFTELNNKINLFSIIECQITEDARPRRKEEKWLNVIMKKIN